MASRNFSRTAVMEFSEITYGAIAGLEGGNRPYGIAVNRKTGKIYVAENGSNSVNVYNSNPKPAIQPRAQKSPK